MNSLPISLIGHEFIELLKGNKIQLENGNDLSSLTESLSGKIVNLDNFFIEEVIIDYNISFIYPITLENCSIGKLIIHNCSFTSLQLLSCKCEKIVIKDTRFDQFTISEGSYADLIFQSSIFKTFKIFGGDFYSIFSLCDSTITQHFEIVNGNFNCRLYFRRTNFKRNYCITGGNFNSVVKIEGCTIIYFEISDGAFHDEIRFHKLNNIDEIWITGGHFEGYFRIIDGNYGHLSIFNGFFSSFNITGGEFSKDVNLYGGIFDFVRITNGSFKSFIAKNDSFYCDKTIINTLHIKTNNPITLTIDSIIIDRILLNYILRRESTILIQNIKPRKIIFKNFTNNGKIIFNNIIASNEYHLLTLDQQLKEILNETSSFFVIKKKNSLEDITNEIIDLITTQKNIETSTLEGLKEITLLAKRYKNLKKEFTILNSFLGDTEFRGVKFVYFQKIFCLNSNLSDIKQHGNFLPSLKEIKYHYPKRIEFLIDQKNKSSKWILRKDFYRDLVIAANRQQDILRKIDYFASYQNSILHSSGSDFSVKLSIWFNKISNDYGRSWILSVLMTVLVLGLIPFSLYMYSLHYELSFKKNDITSTIGYYSQFLIPTHKFDLLKPTDEMNGWSKLFDLLGRILISLGIYQTIQAFRKIGKSGN